MAEKNENNVIGGYIFELKKLEEKIIMPSIENHNNIVQIAEYPKRKKDKKI